MVHHENGGLFTQVQIAPLTSSGHLVIPPSTKYIVMEVGVSDFDTMDVVELPLFPSNAPKGLEPTPVAC